MPSAFRPNCRAASSSASRSPGRWSPILRILLLDEPLSALDPFLRVRMRAELRRFQKQLNIPFIHVTHGQDEALALADLVVVMNKGRIEQVAAPHDLFQKPFKGKAAILNIPSIGIMDAAMVVESTGKYKYPDKGNMTRPEIDMTIGVLTDAKKAGQFRAFWKDFNESVNLMSSGETVIQSMWSPAVTAVRTKGIPCVFQPLKEGYRSWASGFCMSKGVSQRRRHDLRICELVLVRVGGRLPQSSGLLFRRALDRKGQYGAL